jgi:23S rRNA (uracil1939-C5)-methyltransferase
VELRVDAQSFYQGCRDADLALVDAVERAAEREYLDGEHGPVIDAYGGVGLFAASLVPPEVPCIVVELAQAAVDDARINLLGRNAQVVESAVEDWEPEPAGLVIADPSRKGLGVEAIEVLVGTGADRIVLVSCDAAAGARDINLLAKRGYELVYSEVLDMFAS